MQITVKQSRFHESQKFRVQEAVEALVNHIDLDNLEFLAQVSQYDKANDRLRGKKKMIDGYLKTGKIF